MAGAVLELLKMPAIFPHIKVLGSVNDTAVEGCIRCS